MRFACVRNLVIENVIVADYDFLPLIQSQWDYILRVDDLTPEPCIGSTYNVDTGEFTLPEE